LKALVDIARTARGLYDARRCNIPTKKKFPPHHYIQSIDSVKIDYKFSYIG
jgi:hypothetical protein